MDAPIPDRPLADAAAARAAASLGQALLDQGLAGQAEARLIQALKLDPGLAQARMDLSRCRLLRGRPQEALDLADQALDLRPEDPEALFRRANALAALSRVPEALADYRQALDHWPDFPEALVNLGLTLDVTGDRDGAESALRRALAARPGFALAACNLARLLEGSGRLDEAAQAYRTALDSDPRMAEALSGLTALTQRQARLSDLPPLFARMRELAADPDPGVLPPSPFVLLTVTDDPALNLACATKYARRHFPSLPPEDQAPREASPDPRLAVGYASADFHEHATAYLLSEILELHDRSRFRIEAFSFGPPDECPARTRIRAACEAFHDLRPLSDADAAAFIRTRNLDLLVDLKGYTAGSRTGILARRPAPVQVNYLGYPGTMGADFMDYLIADPVVLPPGSQVHYAERPVILPRCCQPNDRKRPRPGHPQGRGPDRAALGLPASGFVFCSLGNPAKITPDLFSVWMELLRNLPGSVLWLLATNPRVPDNLRAEAARARMDPDRLVFAPVLPLARHLARYPAADLFLDTFPYTGHTTMSDALWAGLPAVTIAGRGFASRVAASLLANAGLPQLAAPDPAAYAALALTLAQNPDRLATLRAHLAAVRTTCPLFDSPTHTRHLEAAYTEMTRLHRTGRPPHPLVLRVRG